MFATLALAIMMSAMLRMMFRSRLVFAALPSVASESIAPFAPAIARLTM